MADESGIAGGCVNSQDGGNKNPQNTILNWEYNYVGLRFVRRLKFRSVRLRAGSALGNKRLARAEEFDFLDPDSRFWELGMRLVRREDG